MRYDYASIGFYTFDCLGRPVGAIPPGGGTQFIEEIDLAVSGAAGAAVIAAAKHGLNCLAVGAVGDDLMAGWVMDRLASFGVDISTMQRLKGVGTSTSIVLTRADGSRPALHMKGATGAFVITPDMWDKVLDATVVHLGGVGLMDHMDGAPSAELFAEAKRRGAITTVDVFAAAEKDLDNVVGLLPHTDYFLPSIEEARVLSGLEDVEDVARFFLDKGVTCCILTLGENGAYYRHSNGDRFLMPAFDIEMICSCGCGDAFNAGIATGLVRGMDPESMVRFAQATSAQNALGLGSQAGVTSFDQTLAFTRRATRTPTIAVHGAARTAA
ncbi:carbohydrate kinase family protein [Aureimonas phyllosphaerae]|uniref:Sugar/nucleoside kinase (Ribokinase family) n=1 Tax=Aureimonas phyllosphaerae TaxID=1166078 RepID=A0A7W6BVZ1_9HYPH|nr:PfkB family carbohydrate kinase [Aureimonas phyllosphaerae]MBB3935740.1 sugar/nucleoside kinase (ribokinase family) [Aureimonas phyllosphaerae]MBB3959748.1 sugar/nucleoside kinase (ribokinase family) [Aureimonas phyllosphaerae]SFF14540.1 Sugar or nucleoside kinase, ribokinase family [Aureimonas phyllosphaerae]